VQQPGAPATAELTEPEESPTGRLARATSSAAGRRRLARWRPRDKVSSWYWAGIVALLAGAIRMIDLANPPQKIFDEVYYAKDSHDVIHHGYELNATENGPGLVAHPPLGKWCIGLGEWLFGYNSLGWRFSAALFGTASVLLMCRLGRRMFRSTPLGCLAGALLALDGLHFVSSRVALLDIFLMFFCLASFACLVLDREQRRGQLYDALVAAGDDTLENACRPRGLRYWPWWRIASAALLGCGLAVKWSAIWFLPLFLLFIVIWEMQARRTAGIRRFVSDTIAWETIWLAAFIVLTVATFLASYTGWFATDGGFDRHWAEQNNATVWYLPDAIVSLWHYQYGIYEFHAHLTAPHAYQSSPLSWLIMKRPVLYYYETDGSCNSANCSSTILALGNPALWWTFLVAAAVCLWRSVANRDWRALSILLCAAASILPWMMYPDRTMYFFYALPSLPFFVLAVTLGLGLILGPAKASAKRRLTGALIVGAYVVIVAVAFAYFYPILSGQVISYDDWKSHMWFSSWT
jgi:dolichyl-phosphate-mannose--protein O-mannosyl transferase